MSKDYLSRKAQVILIAIPLALFLYSGGLFLLIILWPVTCVLAVIGIFFFFAPPKSWEKTSAKKRTELQKRVESACGLAPIPPTANDLRIETEGNPFARRYQMIFTDEPENIRKWLESSPGFTAAKELTDGSYPLKIPEAFEKKAVHAWINLLHDGTRVYLKMSAS